MSNKEAIKAVETNNTNATVVVAVPKTQIANAIFKDMFAMPVVPARKDMIAAAMKQANISKDCAATYLQNYKRKNGLQKNSAPATA